MIKIKGILKKEEIKQFTKKDGTNGAIKNIFIEPEGSIYPIKISTSNLDLKIGKEGAVVELAVEAYPYSFVDGKRKRAFLDFYIPNK
ncbi:MAG: hypothetical protein US83_C0011G0047 [Candidatus Falkowbacteria bacterium GW2011_GWC2_38_22]|uniref:Uncharacterized protein n=1 Tax=Candidatus Falkowbacteria bacterium GW2011_GWE1_38_31 TaxID=1618638 RepID=A0A0G0M832_9BACT|nr:MAG: hypothetical protein US73_C0009G0047 [Candidatus Falkowbacteria bacterium GW2011_GWF2_38_1205]KKQ60929.1 MAG: hypothetical protein US83_C0011G0047 [Candidatus Falkowbacteria bacterium GW2011_GWC2_38_22]KKQ63047.1 MAG: hypothetical protein US84_C0009G0047 [Candidatus Falkowbacteria bacterium GW2011_GWF1_38_22]KKQ65069.1 MAG: hypothetical protein US87_C0009G0047 [Candidatus Falkowbacteria bacterium GW2011_GWE2_38_254]KKQ69844.1 MAG: hypothetical protein US91_C0009G0047 [Candidatus Falkowb